MCSDAPTIPAAPAPDPRIGEATERGIALQERYLNDIALPQWKQYQQTVADAAPHIKRSMDLSLDQAETNNEASKAYLNRLQNVFWAEEDSFRDQISKYGTDAHQAEEAARAQADVTRSFDNSEAQLSAGLAASGIAPDSGKALALRRQSAIDRGATMALASKDARDRSKMQGLALKEGFIAMGRGLPGASTASSSLASNQAATSAGMTSLPGQQMLAGQNALAQGFSGASAANFTGANALTNQYGQQLNAWDRSNQYALRQYEADSANTNALWSAAGMVGGAALGSPWLGKMIAGS